MKTATYASVLQRACELTGRVYSELTTEEATLLRGYLARALRWTWEHYPWPDLLNYTQEYFAPTYSASTTYAAGTVVYFPGTGTYYVACQSTTGNPPATHNLATDVYTIVYDQWQYAYPSYNSASGGNWISTKAYSKGNIVFDSATATFYTAFAAPPAGTVVTNTSYWFPLTPFTRYVDKILNPDGTTRTTEIGEILEIYPGDPRVTRQQAKLEREFIGQTMLVRYALPFVWCFWRQAPPALATDPATIPYRFAEIISGRAAGAMLVLDGKAEIGSAMVALSENDMADEADKVAMQEGQIQRTTVYAR